MIYLQLFLEFLKIGAFTFGGGYATIPLITEIVIKYNWMSMQELIDFIAISESTPGTFAVNISTYVGAKTAGILGSIVAILGLIIPCFVIIVIIAKIYEKFKENIIVKGLLFGLTSTVVGLITSTVLTIAKEIFFPNGIDISVLSSSGFYVSLFIFALSAFLLLNKKIKINPISIIGISACLGIVAGYTGLIPV